MLRMILGKLPGGTAGGKHAFNGNFVHQSAARDIFYSLLAKPSLRVNNPVFDPPRMVFKDWRWAEEADRWASGGRREVHGCRIHAHEKPRIF